MKGLVTMSKEVVLAVDFNNIAYGSYYSEKLINSKNMNVNAIKGFFFKMKMYKEGFNPDYIVMANDLSRERTFRRKLCPTYKGQRKPMDPDMRTQMKYISQLCALLGYPFINNELYEADDILGMLSEFCADNDMILIIVSSDHDLYQLLNDNTCIFSPHVKEVIDKQWLYMKYRLTPDQWIDLKILQGDRSDNIPGIPGIGETTALKLMQQYGSVNEIYRHISVLNPKLQQLLKDGEKFIPLTRKLVTIVRDYTCIDMDHSKLLQKERFPREIYELIDELELHSLFNVMKYSLLLDKELDAA